MKFSHSRNSSGFTMISNFVTSIYVLLCVLFLHGCGNNSIEEREFALDRTFEPGTIDYIYESISITIEKTKNALEMTKEHNEEMIACVGEYNYKLIVSDIKNKIEYLEGEKPWFITKLFFGDKPPFIMPKNYHSHIRNSIEDMLSCIENKVPGSNATESSKLDDSKPTPTQKQLSPDQVFEEAEKQANKEYNSKWQAVKNDPAKFLNDCKSQDMNMAMELGGMNPVEAEKQATVNCNTQLTALKHCMDKPNANATNCYENFEPSGD